MINKVLQGDCLELMRDIPDNYIDLTVTSPPYDNLRTYNGSLEWGEHIWQPILKELYRITKQGGVVVWVVGDATIKGSETGTSFKQALFFKEMGFNLHDTMIYASDKPPLSHNRYEQKFEYMFVFSKGKPKTFNPIMEDCKYAGEVKSARTFRHTGEDLGETHNKTAVKHKKIKGNIWTYSTGFNKSTKDKIAFRHPAIFPEKLAQDHIISWSNEGDLVLDCFAGRGTTAIACMNTNRNYILMEKEQKYYDIINKRIESHVKKEG